MFKVFKIWWRYTINSFQQSLLRKKAAILVLISKGVRISLFLLFLNSFLTGAQTIGGYTREQVIFFYLTFNIIDTSAQLFFREVYRFRQLVITGNLDYVLAKPINPLLRVMFAGADIFDLIMLIVLLSVTLLFAIHSFHPSPWLWVIYVVMIINSLVIAASFHIFVLGLGVMTTTVDHLIMVYRDVTQSMRIPVDLYVEPLRSLLTFVIPLGIMITFPAKVLMGILSPGFILISFSLAGLALWASLQFWHFALSRYQSASS